MIGREKSAGDEGYLFSGLKVLDVGTWIAGPVAATILADYGADVIKVEMPGMGDRPSAVTLYAAIVTALLRRERTREGGRVHMLLNQMVVRHPDESVRMPHVINHPIGTDGFGTPGGSQVCTGDR